MIHLYRIILPILGILSLPYYAFRMIRRGGYSNKFSFRFGLWPKLPPPKKGKTRIWIQAVSVGELSSLSKLLNFLLNESDIEVVLSGTTSTGLALAEKHYGSDVLANGPFPLDWLPFSRTAWRRIKPDLAILVDSELWPEHFHQAKRRKIPLIIVNARLSDRTFGRLRSPKLHWALPLLFPSNLTVVASSERQRSRWLELNFPEKNLHTSGNLKIDAVERANLKHDDRAKVRKELGFGEKTLVLAGVSTWSGEEKFLIDLVHSLRLEKIDLQLLLIPRHAERRNEIMGTLKTSGLSYDLRSKSQSGKIESIAYLADTTGEVLRLLQSADIAFMGKSLPPHHGGQNPIEPVSLGLPLVMGPNNQNFRETCSDLISHNALIIGENASEVNSHIIKLAKQHNLREDISHNCISWMKKQGTPSEYTLSLIRKIIDDQSSK